MNAFKSVKTVLSELWINKVRLFRLAVYELKSQHGGTVLGFLWNFLTPMLEIAVYWFVFAIGLKKGNDVNGIPYVVWLLVGIFCWFYVSKSMLGSNTSITQFSDVLKRMKFPMAIVPAKTVMANLITHLCSQIIIFAVVLISGHKLNASIFMLPYCILASTVFCLGYGYIASTINVLFRDFNALMSTVMRFFFFTSPIMWQPDGSNKFLNLYIKINPFAYMINCYRDAYLYTWDFTANIDSALIFWGISIVMLFIGFSMHMKLRHRFIALI